MLNNKWLNISKKYIAKYSKYIALHIKMRNFIFIKNLSSYTLWYTSNIYFYQK